MTATTLREAGGKAQVEQAQQDAKSREKQIHKRVAALEAELASAAQTQERLEAVAEDAVETG